MSTGPKQAWGGARPGAGRKPKERSITAEQLRHMLEALKRAEQKYGKSLDDFILDLYYGQDTNDSAKVAIWKTFKECTMARLVEGSPADTLPDGDIGLPPLKADPAKVVRFKDEDDDDE